MRKDSENGEDKYIQGKTLFVDWASQFSLSKTSKRKLTLSLKQLEIFTAA